MTKPEAAAATFATLYGFPTPPLHPRLMTMMSRAMDGFPLPFVKGMEERPDVRLRIEDGRPPGALYIFEPQGLADSGPCVSANVYMSICLLLFMGFIIWHVTFVLTVRLYQYVSLLSLCCLD